MDRTIIFLLVVLDLAAVVFLIRMVLNMLQYGSFFFWEDQPQGDSERDHNP